MHYQHMRFCFPDNKRNAFTWQQNRFRKADMDFASIYSFLFESMEGIGCLVGAGIVISIIFAAITERKTRKTFVDRGERPDEDLFED